MSETRVYSFRQRVMILIGAHTAFLAYLIGANLSAYHFLPFPAAIAVYVANFIAGIFFGRAMGRWYSRTRHAAYDAFVNSMIARRQGWDR